MKKSLGVAFSIFAVLATQSAAGVQAQAPAAAQAALRQCIEMSTTGADRVLTAQWMFAAIAKSPHITGFVNVTDQRKIELDKGFAKLMTRLIVKDCIEQMRPLAADDLKNAFELMGRALGEVAMGELMNDKNVDTAIGAYTDHLSEQDFKPLIDSVASNQSK